MKKLLASTILTGVLAFGTGVSADEIVDTVDPGTTPDEFLFTFDQLFEELKLLVPSMMKKKPSFSWNSRTRDWLKLQRCQLKKKQNSSNKRLKNI